jgi:hypothetical protein
VQPAGSGGVFTLLDAKLTALPPLGDVTLGEVMLDTELIRLVAPVTSELLARGSAVETLLCRTDDVPDGGTSAQLGVGAVVL